MKYTFYLLRGDEEKTIIVTSHKAALRIIKRFVKKPVAIDCCESLFIYLSRKDVPTYQARAYGHYFKTWEGIRFKRKRGQ